MQRPSQQLLYQCSTGPAMRGNMCIMAILLAACIAINIAGRNWCRHTKLESNLFQANKKGKNFLRTNKTVWGTVELLLRLSGHRNPTHILSDQYLLFVTSGEPKVLFKHFQVCYFWIRQYSNTAQDWRPWVVISEDKHSLILTFESQRISWLLVELTAV